MSDNPDRPFGHHTLKLRAVFVPEGVEHRISMADIAGTTGYRAVKLPAVFVPEGGIPELAHAADTQPGVVKGPHNRTVRIGPAAARPSPPGAAPPAVQPPIFSRSPAGRPVQPTRDEATAPDEPGRPVLPRTRYRLDIVRPAPGAPPNPVPPSAEHATLRAAIDIWRSVCGMGRIVAADGSKASSPWS